MNRLVIGILLILMMFGHNYVLNQPQVLQSQFQTIHQVSVHQFNSLYAIPSFVSIFFILPLGVLYDKYSGVILIGAALSLMLGQLLVSIFGANTSSSAFTLLTIGRVFQGTAAQLLYMIQANLSSSWMGKLAGLTLILPEFGQIANVFFTIKIKDAQGIQVSLFFGFLTCFVSFVACLFLYQQILKYKKIQIVEQVMGGGLQGMKQQQKDEDIQEDKQIKVGNSNQTKLVFQLETGRLNNQNTEQNPLDGPNPSIFQASHIFWLVVVLCAINECLYFPFLDNAKVLIQTRFCVPSEKTSFYLCLPYLSAILVSIFVGEHMLQKYSRAKLIFISSLLPLLGHLMIYLIDNCQEGQTTLFQELFLILGFVFFGTGIAGYYSISMPAVGLAVPEKIRGRGYFIIGTAFAFLGFLQTLTMTVVPILSGYIIEQDSNNYMKGYKNSSFLFVCLCVTASLVSFYIMWKSTASTFKYSTQLVLDLGKKGQQISQSHSVS